ncbi:MAG: hypothetical protein ACLF0G_12365 [Candidatus Brocadiia bacterium]
MSTRPLLATALLVCLALATQAAYFVSPARPGLPLDDGWIHATFARNLARHGELCLNPGEPSTGTTSFLWTGLLAAAHRLVGEPVLAPCLLNAAAQAALVVLCFLHVRAATGERGTALLAAGSVALLGNLVWISLSGMETTPFLVLALAAVWARAGERWLAAGVLAGLLVLTRPEGLALALAMGLLELWALRRGGRPPWGRWAKLFAPTLATAALYVGVNLAITGRALTSTFLGRRWLAGQPAALRLGPLALLRQGGQLAVLWGRYFHRWLFGGGLLLHLGVRWGLAAAAVLGVAMGLVALVGLARVVGEPRGAAGRRSPMPLLLLWALLHNAVYAVLLPVPSHGGRYQAINIVLAVVLIVVGGMRLGRTRRLRPLGLGALALWAALCLSGTALWRTIYRDSVDHINSVHVACGRWIAENLPRDAVVATFDLGAVSYFSERRIIDLGGLVDPRMARCLFEGDAVPYLREQGVTHVAMMRRDVGNTRLARQLGLRPPGPGRPRLERLRRWAVEPQRFVLHHRATANAMPIIILYKWHEPPAER